MRLFLTGSIAAVIAAKVWLAAANFFTFATYCRRSSLTTTLLAFSQKRLRARGL